MKRYVILGLLVSMFLFLCGITAQAEVKDVTLDAVTNQQMVVNGATDKPYVSIVVFDKKTNQIIGQGDAKADKSIFSSKIVFSSPLNGDSELTLNVTDFDDYGNKTISEYRIILNCWTQQPVNPQSDPCSWLLHGPILSDETM
jgi:hypothetical protein